MHICNPSTREEQTRGSVGLSYQSSLFSKFQASEMPYLKKAKWVALRNANQRWPLTSTYTQAQAHPYIYTHQEKLQCLEIHKEQRSVIQTSRSKHVLWEELEPAYCFCLVCFSVLVLNPGPHSVTEYILTLPHGFILLFFSFTEIIMPRTISIYSHYSFFLQTLQKAYPLKERSK